MFTVYIYVLDTLADWELGYVTAELNSGRFFKKDAPEVSVKTVAISTEPVKTMGGLTIVLFILVVLKQWKCFLTLKVINIRNC